MDGIREYILSVVAAAVLCCVLTRLVGKKGSMGSLFRLITGIFLAFTVIKPVAAVKLEDLTLYVEDISMDAQAVAAMGQTGYQESIAGIIKRETEAYILDKAQLLDADVTVDVELDDQIPPIPCGVRLTGSVSPYIKAQLQDMMESDLGIQKERQIWTE